MKMNTRKKILHILVYYLFTPLLYVFNIIFSMIGFIYKLIYNLLEKKCKENPDDIIGINYYSEEWPDLVSFQLYFEDKIPKQLERFNDNTKINKKDFNVIVNEINNNQIINKKTYILNWPFVSLKEYYFELYAEDAGPTRQTLIIYFRDGSSKRIEGYSKEMSNIRKEFENVLPQKIFGGY